MLRLQVAPWWGYLSRHQNATRSEPSVSVLRGKVAGTWEDKRMKWCSIPVMAAIALLSMGGGAQALLDIATVAVDNYPPNAADPATDRGAVSYDYLIGKYEVTASEYTAFLNAVAVTDTYELWTDNMVDLSDFPNSTAKRGCNIVRSGSSGSYSYTVASDWADRPVNHVSWGSAARFCNWLHNGQPTGAQDLTTTEDGAYFVNGVTTKEDLNLVTRKTNWKYAIPTENEWYKAAYYDPAKAGGTGGYWIFPTRTDSPPSNVGADGYIDPGNHCNYLKVAFTIGSLYFRTKVGEFENSASAYGTFDQGGNLFEWMEDKKDTVSRILRGASYQDQDAELAGGFLRSNTRDWNWSIVRDRCVGFRIAKAVPEPSSILALLSGLAGVGGLAIRRKRA